MEKLMADVLFVVQSASPYKTGDLMRSFQVEKTEDGFVVWTEMDYMQFTNEPWGYNSHWGKTLNNPNVYWFDEVVKYIAEYIAGLEGGYVVIK